MDKLKKIADLLRKYEPGLSFNFLEIGARPTGEKEAFHNFVELFPGSKVSGFEVEQDLCDQMNKTTPDGFEYYPYALGEKEESRPFYIAESGMCSSLYKPNATLLEKYNEIADVMALKEVIEVETVPLNKVFKEKGIEAPDFIKIDVQGAELDILKGATDILDQVLCIITEVEFVPLYEKQPLYEDVSSFLREQGFMFHKFQGFGTRNLKPIVLMNKPLNGTQLLWADAMFFKDLDKIDEMESARLLKLAMIAGIYGSIDVVFFCIRKYSERENVPLIQEFSQLMNSPN